MTLVLAHDPFIIIFSYTLLKGSLTVTCPFASILSALITISKTHTSSPLGTEGVVMSMSEMKLKRKSVSIDTKLAAIKALGEGNSVREHWNCSKSKEKAGRLTDRRIIDAIQEIGSP